MKNTPGQVRAVKKMFRSGREAGACQCLVPTTSGNSLCLYFPLQFMAPICLKASLTKNAIPEHFNLMKSVPSQRPSNVKWMFVFLCSNQCNFWVARATKGELLGAYAAMVRLTQQDIA